MKREIQFRKKKYMQKKTPCINKYYTSARRQSYRMEKNECNYKLFQRII